MFELILSFLIYFRFKNSVCLIYSNRFRSFFMRQVFEFIVQISVVFLKFNKLSSTLIGNLILDCSLNPILTLNE